MVIIKVYSHTVITSQSVPGYSPKPAVLDSLETPSSTIDSLVNGVYAGVKMPHIQKLECSKHAR